MHVPRLREEMTKYNVKDRDFNGVLDMIGKMRKELKIEAKAK